MVVFLTSVRHPHNANDYRQVEALLEMSLRSVCAQTDPDFAVVVVCNVRPDLQFHDPRVIFHVVDFPPGSPQPGTITHEPIVKRDKGTKKLSGLLLARRFDPDYIFFFDADDLVSRRVVEFANARVGQPGWYVDGGYVISLATRRIQRKHGLVRYCGTSLMPNARALYAGGDLDSRLDETASQDELLSEVSPTFVEDIVGDHVHMVRYFAEHGLRMRPLPFRAAAWVQETGENVVAARTTDSGIPVNRRFREEFGFDVTGTPPAPAGPLDRAREFAVSVQSRVGSLIAGARHGY